MSDIKRRDFIALCGGAAVGWPLTARAQPAGRMRRIGILLLAGREQEGISPFLQGLEALGYIDGKTVAIETATRRERTSGFPSWPMSWCASIQT